MNYENSTLKNTQHLIERYIKGNLEARNELIELMHTEISSIASAVLRREQRHVSIVTGDLVNDSMIRLMQSKVLNITDKAHFLALCAKVMRQTLLDMAKERGRDKRKGFHVTLTDAKDDRQTSSVDLIYIERAIQKLYEIDPVRATVVELKYFGGMSVEEIANVLEISPATVKRKWSAARLWLMKTLDDSD